MIEIAVKLWGDFACFTRSDAKINRVTYDVPTPSACRGALEAIYCKPNEFWYEITSIRVLSPIRAMAIKKNEVKTKANKSCAADMRNSEVTGGNAQGTDIYARDMDRTQRTTIYLRNVSYIVEARVHIRDDYKPSVSINSKERKFSREFNKRVEHGKCYAQPYFGLRECLCYFSFPEGNEEPIVESKDLGVMLYDIFDPRNIEPLDTDPKYRNNTTNITYYHPFMINGVINVPPIDSPEIFRVLK